MRRRSQIIFSLILMSALLLSSCMLLRKGGRMVRDDGAAVLMAVDEKGLARLHSLYVLPTSCVVYTPGQGNECLHWRPIPLPPEAERGGLLTLPSGTKAKAYGAAYLLSGGQTVVPYPLHSPGYVRNRVVEVERVTITSGPSKGAEGWVVLGSLGRTTYPY